MTPQTRQQKSAAHDRLRADCAAKLQTLTRAKELLAIAKTTVGKPRADAIQACHELLAKPTAADDLFRKTQEQFAIAKSAPAKPTTAPAALRPTVNPHASLAAAILDEQDRRDAAAKIKSLAEFKKLTPREASAFCRAGGKITN